MRHLLWVALALVGWPANAITVVNGSFEIGIDPGKSTLLVAGDTTSLPGWTVIGQNIDIVGTAWLASDGVRSVDLSGVAPGGIEQTIDGLTPGQRYAITFDMSGSYHSIRTFANHMSVQASDNAAQYYVYDKDNTVDDMMYSSLSYLFTPTATSSLIQFNGLDQGDYGAVLDNVAVVPIGGGVISTVAEPMTWAMMVGGFGLMGLTLRRRAVTRPVTA